MTRHLFRNINELFRPNNRDDIAREEPISLKKTTQRRRRLEHKESHPRLGNRHGKTSSHTSRGPQGKPTSPTRHRPPWYQPMLTKTLAQIARNSTEHRTRNSGSGRNDHPPTTRVEKGERTQDKPDDPSTRRINSMASPSRIISDQANAYS